MSNRIDYTPAVELAPVTLSIFAEVTGIAVSDIRKVGPYIYKDVSCVVLHNHRRLDVTGLDYHRAWARRR